MPWLKRNLYLVIGVVVALGLLGFAGFFLFQKIAKDREATAQVAAATDQLTALVNRDPHPGTETVDNISAAKEEEQRLAAFLSQVRQFFQPMPLPQELSSREFRALLDNTVSQLQRRAERSGVEVPKDYWFTFGSQKNTVDFKPNALPILVSQLGEIKALCEILFGAKVTQLTSVKRVAVTSEDNANITDFLGKKIQTNQWAIVTPYEITFQGFSSELADVLEGLVQSPISFVVKNIAVAQATQQQTQADGYPTPYYPPQGMYPPGRAPAAGGMPPELAARYGLSSRYGGRPGPMPAPMPVAPPPPRPTGNRTVTLVEEKPLNITLQIDVVKLKPAGTPYTAPSSPEAEPASDPAAAAEAAAQ
jgi:hypothetical protein